MSRDRMRKSFIKRYNERESMPLEKNVKTPVLYNICLYTYTQWMVFYLTGDIVLFSCEYTLPYCYSLQLKRGLDYAG